MWLIMGMVSWSWWSKGLSGVVTSVCIFLLVLGETSVLLVSYWCVCSSFESVGPAFLRYL